MGTNPYAKYKQVQVETNNPVQLVVMMYEGAIKALRRAEILIEQKDYAGKGRELMKAHDIVFELLSSLDRERGGDIAQNLEGLYVWMIRQILEANISLETSVIDDVIENLETLNEAWKEIAQQQKAKKAPTTSEKG